MPLTPDDAVDQAKMLLEYHEGERAKLDEVRRYWKGRQRLPRVIPDAAPSQVREMARIARVNVIGIVIDTLAQSLFVDGFRGDGEAGDADVWAVWQANRLDARQTGIHRAACAYGAAYATVLPGDPAPVIRGLSPRRLTALYGDDPDWPVWALERRRDGTWRLYDDESVYRLEGGPELRFVESYEHGAGVTPVVRYLDAEDLDVDDDVDGYGTAGIDLLGQVAPLVPVQDQIDLTTFGLLVAQHYSAFRQRYVLGWVAETEAQQMRAAASQLWTFADHPDDVRLGEFSETDLAGYIASREASLRHGATLSQTPVHELIGELVNLSAEALAAAEAGRDRKVDERKTLFGEAHEQMLWLAGRLAGYDVPVDAQVVWRDTSARAFAATVDGLGKLAQMLGVPPQELWERIPGVSRQDVERWRAAAESGDVLGRMLAEFENQALPLT